MTRDVQKRQTKAQKSAQLLAIIQYFYSVLLVSLHFLSSLVKEKTSQ